MYAGSLVASGFRCVGRTLGSRDVMDGCGLGAASSKVRLGRNIGMAVTAESPRDESPPSPTSSTVQTRIAKDPEHRTAGALAALSRVPGTCHELELTHP